MKIPCHGTDYQIRNKIKCQKFTHWIIRNLSPDSPLYPTSTDICNIKEYETIALLKPNKLIATGIDNLFIFFCRSFSAFPK
ncbi:unnamed protein product [Rhizophagus irregularis]|nr:unnamed protein product [Rhizophagus irregularis]